MWHRLISRLHSQRGVLHAAFVILPLIYGAVVRTRNALYRSGAIKPMRLPGRVVSIGNITVGGTGKTPAAMMIARRALARGRRVCILTRGYGGRRSGSRPLAVSDTEGVLASAKEAGDEAFLMAGRLPGVPVVACADRYKGGLEAAGRWGCDLFILDDGFQHLALARDADIVLVDWKNPFGNGLLLPLGPLREPPQSLTRADAIILTRAEPGKAKMPDAITALPGRMPPCFTAEHRAESIVIPAKGRSFPVEYCSGRRVLGFAGIGDPMSFRKTLESLGAGITAFKAFSDHHPYSDSEMRRLSAAARMTGADLVLTTEKDWVRLGRWDSPVELGYVEIDFRVSGEDEFFALLQRLVG